MRIVYLGSPDFAVPPLIALHQAGYDIALVVSQPDKPRHRGKMQPTAVKEQALQLGLPVLTPPRVNAPDSVAAIAACRPDLLVVVAYGQLLGDELLHVAPLGAVNIHGSLLPAYRGAAPIQWALINGESETGVTIMYVQKALDSGDIIATATTPLSADDTTGALHDRLCALGTQLLLDTLPALEQGTAPRRKQDDALATYAPMLTKEMELLDWTRSATELHDLARAFDPWPGCYTFFNNKRLKLWSTAVAEGDAPDAVPGQVVRLGKDSLDVRCGSGLLRVAAVQPEGKGRMSAADFQRGYGLSLGTIFGLSE